MSRRLDPIYRRNPLAITPRDADDRFAAGMVEVLERRRIPIDVNEQKPAPVAEEITDARNE